MRTSLISSWRFSIFGTKAHDPMISNPPKNAPSLHHTHSGLAVAASLLSLAGQCCIGSLIHSNTRPSHHTHSGFALPQLLCRVEPVSTPRSAAASLLSLAGQPRSSAVSLLGLVSRCIRISNSLKYTAITSHALRPRSPPWKFTVTGCRCCALRKVVQLGHWAPFSAELSSARASSRSSLVDGALEQSPLTSPPLLTNSARLCQWLSASSTGLGRPRRQPLACTSSDTQAAPTAPSPSTRRRSSTSARPRPS